MIREVILQVGDVDEAVAFYRDACGFAHVRTVEQNGCRVAEMDAGGSRITLVPAGGAGIHLALASDNARADRRRLRRMDVDGADAEPRETEDGVWVGFTDPWGNRLGFFEDTSER